MKINYSFKWLALVLALILSLSLFACADESVDGVDDSKTTDTKAEEVTEKETDAEESKATESDETKATEATEVTETESETEAATEPPVAKCKHKNAEVSIEKGCIVWCPDCESQVGQKTYHKNSLVYFDNDGYYNVCSICNQKNGDGKRYLVDWNAEALNGANAAGIVGVYNEAEGYTRFEGNGKVHEAHFAVVPADEFNSEITGQYLMIKYRTNVSQFIADGEATTNYPGNIQIYYSTATATVGKGKLIDYKATVDNEWHIAIFDLSDGSTYAPDKEGNYIAKHLRVDLLNPSRVTDKNDAGEVTKTYAPLPEGYYMDVAFIAMCDDPDAFVDYFEANEGDKALCKHEARYVNDNCEECCAGCGQVYGTKHTYDCVVENADGVSKYVMPCVKCDEKLEYTVEFGDKAPNLFLDPKYLADAVAAGTRMGDTEFFVEDGSGFVRLHANPAVDREANFMLIPSGSTTVTGQYMIIKYRTTCNYAWEIFMGGEGTKPGEGGHYYIENFPADGEWQLLLIDLSDSRFGGLKANSKGEFILGHYRWDIFNTVSPNARYIDIAYVAFAEDLSTLKAINGEFAKYCNHSKLEPGFTLVTNDDDVAEAPMRKGICSDCGSEVVAELNRKFFLDDLIGNADANSRDASQYDLGLGGFTASKDNTITIKGWQGIDFGSEAIAYKVYDKDGNLLSGDWTVFEGVKFSVTPEGNGVTNAVVAAGVDAAYARRFDNLVLDLTDYFAQSDNLTIEYAFVINGVPETSKDVFAPFLTITNITIAKEN